MIPQAQLALEKWNRCAREARELITALDADPAFDNELVIRSNIIMARFGEANVTGWRVPRDKLEDPGAVEALREALYRRYERKRDRDNKLEDERKAEAMTRWHRVTVGGADITEHVAAMFDAIVGSMDWGSGFLDVETIESILIVAHLVGFDIPEAKPDDQLIGVTSSEEREQIIAKWKAQVAAKVAALRGEDQ